MVRLVFEDTPGEVQVWESGGGENWQQWQCSHASNSASCGLGVRGGSQDLCKEPGNKPIRSRSLQRRRVMQEGAETGSKAPQRVVREGLQ